jgi:MFS family permease
MIIDEGIDKLRKRFSDLFRVEALILLFSIVMSLVLFGEQIYGAFLYLFLKDFGVPVVQLGAFALVYSLFNAVVSLPAGYISDRIGRNLITLSLFALGGVVFCYTLAHTTTQLLLLRAVHGGVIGFIFPIARAYVMDKTTEENRGQALGTFALLTTLASMAAPTVGGVIRDYTGTFNPLFYLGTIFPMIAAVFFLVQFRELGTGFTVQKMKLPTRELLGNRVFLIILLMFGMLYFASGILTPIMSIFAVDELGMTYTMLGLLGTSLGILYAVSQFVAGTMSDRLGRKRLLVYPLFIYVVGVSMAGLSVNPVMFFVSYMLVGIGAAPYATVAYSLIGDVTVQSQRGTASGAVICVCSIGSMVGPVLGSAVGGLTSLRVPFFLCAAMVVATIAMLYFALPQDTKKVSE